MVSSTFDRLPVLADALVDAGPADPDILPNCRQEGPHVRGRWAKGSGGTDSSRGTRFVERVLSIRETCRQQSQSLLDYLAECCQAHLEAKASPSLLPKGGSYLEVA